MVSDTLAFSSNVFGFVMGGITLLTLLINLINVLRFHLPSNKIKVLESLLDDTETSFQKALEEGLLIDLNFVEDAEQRLEILKRRTCTLKSNAYGATTLSKDYAEFFRGTSGAIGATCQSLKNLRAEVVTCSEERRRILMEMSDAPQVQVVQAIPPLNPEPLNHPTLKPIADIIPRPRSCPATLSESRTVDTQSVASSDNPFSDHPEIDSDVNTVDVSFDTSSVYTSANLELKAREGGVGIMLRERL